MSDSLRYKSDSELRRMKDDAGKYWHHSNVPLRWAKDDEIQSIEAEQRRRRVEAEREEEERREHQGREIHERHERERQALEEQEQSLRDTCPACGGVVNNGELEASNHEEACPWLEAFEAYWMKYADGQAAVVHANASWEQIKQERTP